MRSGNRAGKREKPRGGRGRRGASDAGAPTRATATPTYERIYAVVRRIPKGRVATYGQVAALAARPGQARLVGYALHALPATTAVPWHRVINAQGRISTRRSEPGGALAQQLLLEREGVRVGGRGRVELGKYRWMGKS